MGRLRKLIAGALVVGATVALGACGAAKKAGPGTRTGGEGVVDIYSSLPLTGRSAREGVALLDGIKLALAQAGGRAGGLTVNYISLNDATAAAGGWDPARTAAAARRAASDPRAVYYIGELDSAASKVSIPILNQAGIPQVSPTNAYAGLTVAIPGVTAPGEPQKYFPTGQRTYLRIMPTDIVQAAADLQAMKQAGCARVAVAADGEPYGTGLATLLKLESASYGIDVAGAIGIDPEAPSVRSSAARIKRIAADCFEFAGTVSGAAVQITKDLHAALPNARIFGPDRMCTSSWTSALPTSIDAKIECTRPTLELTAYPGGRAFLAAYRARFGVFRPNPYAIYGYEAMKLGLDTIASLGPDGEVKTDVLKALLALRDRHSVLGTYGFDKNGDTTLRSYGLYRVGANGDPVFHETLTPMKVR